MKSMRTMILALSVVGLAGYLAQTASQEKATITPKKDDSRRATEQPTSSPTRPAEAGEAVQAMPTSSDRAARATFRTIHVESAAESEARSRIEKALSQQGSFTYPMVPLTAVVQDLASRFEIPVVVNLSALEDAGVRSDTQIDLNVSNVSLRSALAILLREHDLTYRIQNEVLVITTFDEAESVLLTTVFDVSSLLAKESDRMVFRSASGGSELVDVITSTIGTDTWSAAGGTGTIQYLAQQEVLVVSQTQDQTDQIANLLDTLKRVAETRRPVQSSNVASPPDKMIVKIYEIFRYDRASNVLDGIPESGTGKSTASGVARMVRFGGGMTENADAATKMLAHAQANAFDVSTFAQFVPQIIEPGTWGEGQGAIGVFGEHVIVRHLPRVHDQVVQLLGELQLLKPYSSSTSPASPSALQGGGGFF